MLDARLARMSGEEEAAAVTGWQDALVVLLSVAIALSPAAEIRWGLLREISDYTTPRPVRSRKRLPVPRTVRKPSG